MPLVRIVGRNNGAGLSRDMRLVPVSGSRPDHLDTRYPVPREAPESAIESMIRMPETVRQALGEAARRFYLEQRRYFSERLVEVMHEVLADAAWPEVLEPGCMSNAPLRRDVSLS